MYEIMIQKTFAAAHAIRLPDGSLEPLHGHNWPVEVTIASGQLDAMQTVMDFHIVEKILDEILATVHNRNLNDVRPFCDGKINPTAERVAWWIATSVQEQLKKIPGVLPGAGVVSVRVGEAPGCFATYRL